MSEAKMGISFAFTKRKEEKKIKLTTETESEKVVEEPDFVTSLENKEVKSVKPKEKQKEIVIPLIVSNNWKTKYAESKKGKSAAKTDEGEANGLDTQAVQEILADTAQKNEDWQDRDQDKTSYDIPLLMVNKIPEGFETDDKLDVSLRPDEPEDADYEEVPIERYGLAMLRGMGWKQGEGIGKNNKTIAPVEAVLRPKGMGLGADRKQAQTLNQSKQASGTGPEEQLTLKKGAHCIVERGPHTDLYGIIEGTDEDNARLMVKLTVSGMSVSLSQYNVKLVSEKEYKQYSKYINKGAADRYKKKEEARQEKEDKGRKDRERDRHRDSSKKHRKEASGSDDQDERNHHRHEDEQKSSRKRKHEETRHDERKTSSSSKSIWLQPKIRVRVVDKNFKGGRYYGEKVVVVDVASRDHCVCQTEQGSYLEGLSQSSLETVIPKSESAYVAVVRGKYKGQVARVMKRDKSRCEAMLQLLSDRDNILTLEYDSICEYVGNMDEEFDF